MRDLLPHRRPLGGEPVTESQSRQEFQRVAVITALAKRPGSTTRQVADATRLTNPRAYDALTSLRRRGAVDHDTHSGGWRRP